MPRRTISVVIPVFNEESVLEELHRRLAAVLSALDGSYEIIFVDDGSTDRSLEQLRLLHNADCAHVVVVELARNYGQTAALAAGIDHAKGEVIVTMDGDLQHAPEEIPPFIKKLDEGFDLVSGWRQVRLDHPLSRKLPSRCANALMRVISGVKVQDFGSTFKAYRGDLLRRIELFGELHRFIPVLAHRMGARIVEIPISVKPRAKGSSKYGLSRTFGVFEDLIFLQFYSQHLTKPMRAFGKLFFLFFGSGFVIAAALMLSWAVGIVAAVFEHAALLLLSVFLMIVGIQFLMTGVLAELLTRIYLHTGNSKIYTVRSVLGAAAGV